MSSSTSSARPVAPVAPATCTCGGPRLDPVRPGALLVRLDRAVVAGQVTPAEVAERRVQLLAR